MKKSADEHHQVKWVDRGYNPTQPANPDFPNGIDLDMSANRKPSCRVELPYPAKRIGFYIITCNKCNLRTVITTAGRLDDPRSVKLACLKG